MITISAPEIVALTGLKKDEVLEGLNNLGMPAEQDEDEITVEVTPNRPDLFSVEGIARVLNSFYGKQIHSYSAKKSRLYCKIDASVGKNRPYVVLALVKNVRVDESTLKSIIQLQEKLHETIGRKRKKIAIGVHNADMVKFPLIYKFVKEEKFVPLDFGQEMTIDEILERHPKGRGYGHLVKKEGGYPMLYDRGGVISFPPIINSDRTRVDEKTKNMLIELTGTHLGVLSSALNIITCALADRGGEIYEVNVGKEGYPKLKPVKMRAYFDAINKLLGTQLSKQEILDNLKRLGWSHGAKATLLIPPYRMDITQDADVVEDVAIAHGYDRFEPSVPDFFTSGTLAYNNDDIREAMMGLGFVEVVNYALTNEQKLKVLGRKAAPLGIMDPKTTDFTLLRTSPVVSLLDNIASNKSHELPIRIFEIGRGYEGGERICLTFAVCAEALDFSLLRGTLQSLSLVMGKDFELKNIVNDFFTSGRGAGIFLNGKKVGEMGEVSPQRLEVLGIENPLGVCEIVLSEL